MKKFTVFLLVGLVFSNYCFSQTGNITIEINNIVINGGIVYIGIFSDAESFRKEEPEFLFELEAANTTIAQELLLPNGEYVITAIQDANNNKRLDFGLFGIPKELLGISNYNGRGFPSKNFERQKILVDKTTKKIIINLYGF
jgi:uncharacterized protein (DUF2141 family)